ncbi:Bug family tripartite tricarboxylate transporter substrate binding protein [Salinicola halimionae]|uniref:Bug family tripartite tricarboxylate transporter substrate binding protein n=1 Tax=Salinicola halimionae TaxID=1949081 RepID=UPI000DA1B9F7|nr:tripartite tricarboxylate transporter substrate-binding protein [Salinicola halimionae]
MKKIYFGVALAISMASLAASAYAEVIPKGAECIVPGEPGGGLDFTCRSVGRVMEEIGLTTGSIRVVNMPGAGGGVAFAHATAKRSGDNRVIVAASTATITRLAQNQFPGMTSDMVNWIGTLGADYGVIAVRADAPYRDINDLLSQIRKSPKSVKFSGASARGGWDHLKVMMVAKAFGINDLSSIPYLTFNSGGAALTQVVGGHLDAFTGDVSEVMGFLKSGDVRALAILAPERLESPLESIPTAKEQGVDVVGPNWRGFYAPPGVSEKDVHAWVESSGELYASDQWKSVMKANGLVPFHYQGKELEDFIKVQIGELREISSDLGLAQ